MTIRQGMKAGTIKTTNPQSVSKAGEINSTVEDTSGWSTIGGNQVDRGRLALSTSAATTVIGADTAYPNLWANAPVSWRSGSDLVIPAQGVGASDEQPAFTISLGGTPGTTVIDNSFVTVRRRGNKLFLRGYSVITAPAYPPVGGSGAIFIALSETIRRDGGNSVTIWSESATGEGWVNEQSAMLWTGGGSGTASELRIFSSDGLANSSFDYSDLTSTFRLYWDSEFEVPAWDSLLPTPFITLYNNVAANALGLPEASASQIGGINKWNEDLVLVNSGTKNINGTIKITRLDNVVTMTSVGDLTHDSTGSAVSDVELPAWAIPTNRKNGLPMMDNTLLYRCSVFSSGDIELYRGNKSSTGTTAGTSSPFSITYVLD
jgi:hypothetical protein